MSLRRPNKLKIFLYLILVSLSFIFLFAHISSAQSPKPGQEVKPLTPTLSPKQILKELISNADSTSIQNIKKFLEIRPNHSEDEERGAKFLLLFDQFADIDTNKLSSSPEGFLEDGLEPERELVGKLRLGSENIPIFLTQTKAPDGTLRWVVDRDTIRKVSKEEQNVSKPFYQNFLPSRILKISVFGLQVGRWFGIFLSLTAAFLASIVLSGFVKFVIKKTVFSQLPQDFELVLQNLKRPLIFMFTVLCLKLALPYLELPVEPKEIFRHFTNLGFLSGFFVILYKITTYTMKKYEFVLKKNDRLDAAALIPTVQTVMVILLAACYAIFFIRELGYDITTLLAGLGVGGLAVVFGGQKTLENLFGGISVILEQPIKVGDFGRFGKILGHIEGLGLRSVRIRTLERTVVTVPTAEFSQMHIENFQQRDNILWNCKIKLNFQTTSNTIRSVIADIQNRLTSSSDVSLDQCRVTFLGFGSDALVIEIFAYIISKDNGEFLKIRHDLSLEVLDIFSTHSCIPISISATVPSGP